MASNTIKVVARFRPTNKIEAANGGQNVVEFESSDTCSVRSRDAVGDFTFDRVFDMDSQQSDVFEYSIRSTVDDILNGYNGTVFAYGQTGSGKSYTMMGADIDDYERKGIIPRIVEQIFASIMAGDGNIEYIVRVSYMEIYMERIRDLLVPQNDNLPIHEEKGKGVYVKGLSDPSVSTVGEVYEVMRSGGLNRATAATKMNQESSRSHSIFLITVTQKNLESGSGKSGQLFLVDLAGSEKVGKTGASGQTLEEAKKINKSLSALGMVINSLTDGKSTHVPYRDSKLTRILQESLGGNSRTTLIINCSPSSFNADETFSTLRFGERAKKIQNKAKINAELSPAELKALLKKAQSEVTIFQDYTMGLEGEVTLWRRGETVPREQWTPARSETAALTKRPGVRPLSYSATPSRMKSSESTRAETPSRSESRLELDRASTPSTILETDEREEFYRRENELQDQLAARESQLAKAERELQIFRDELQLLREQQKQTAAENETFQGEVSDSKIRVERLQFENRESAITLDGLKEANAELTTELDEVKHQLFHTKIKASESSAALGEKEKKKAERMAEVMSGYSLERNDLGGREQDVRTIIERVDALYNASCRGGMIASDEYRALRKQLEEMRSFVGQAEIHNEAMSKGREALEDRLAIVEREYEEILERNLSDDDIEEVKARLGEAYRSRQSIEEDLVEDLHNDIERSSETNQKLKDELEILHQRLNSGGNSTDDANRNSKSFDQQVADFDIMKKSLMRDLQNRCERVVELEISLDETREQYNNVLRTSNNRAQQKKMAFLERNLEQLTYVQRQLVEQNSALKKEVAIAERKLMARNERISNLEGLLHDSQQKLGAAQHKFEAQITLAKERMAAATAASARGLNASTSSYYSDYPPAGGGFSLSSVGSRIAKPLRGGGGEGGPLVPTVANLQARAQATAQEKDGSPNGEGRGKRGSWFFEKGRWNGAAA